MGGYLSVYTLTRLLLWIQIVMLIIHPFVTYHQKALYYSHEISTSDDYRYVLTTNFKNYYLLAFFLLWLLVSFFLSSFYLHVTYHFFKNINDTNYIGLFKTICVNKLIAGVTLFGTVISSCEIAILIGNNYNQSHSNAPMAYGSFFIAFSSIILIIPQLSWLKICEIFSTQNNSFMRIADIMTWHLFIFKWWQLLSITASLTISLFASFDMFSELYDNSFLTPLVIVLSIVVLIYAINIFTWFFVIAKSNNWRLQYYEMTSNQIKPIVPFTNLLQDFSNKSHESIQNENNGGIVYYIKTSKITLCWISNQFCIQNWYLIINCVIIILTLVQNIYETKKEFTNKTFQKNLLYNE